MPAKKTAKKMTKPAKATKGKAKKTTRAPKMKKETPEVEGHQMLNQASTAATAVDSSLANNVVFQ